MGGDHPHRPAHTKGEKRSGYARLYCYDYSVPAPSSRLITFESASSPPGMGFPLLAPITLQLTHTYDLAAERGPFVFRAI